MIRDIPEGTTRPLNFQLEVDAVAVNGVGRTIGIEIEDRTGASVTLLGSVSWVSAAAGTAKASLDPTDLPVAGSPYLVRWVLTDLAGDVVYVPNGEHADCWRIVPTP